MGKMCKMDQNIPKIQLSTQRFATGGAKGAKSAKMSKFGDPWLTFGKSSLEHMFSTFLPNITTRFRVVYIQFFEKKP